MEQKGGCCEQNLSFKWSVAVLFFDPLSTHIMHSQYELLKWLALVAMTLDHYGKIVAPSVFSETHAIGRLAYPLFAWILASRIAVQPALARKYLVWLLPFALLSQPIFVIAGKTWMQWNIMFTLFFGILASLGIKAAREHNIGQAVALLAVSLTGSIFAEYGPFGVMLTPALILCLQRGENAALIALIPLCLIANITIEAPYFTPIDLFATLAVPVIYLSRLIKARIPRMPKLFFYIYYPGHVYILHLADWYIL